MLRSYVAKDQKDWDKHIPYIMMAYRSSVHDSTGFTPNEMMMGSNVRLPIDIVYGSAPVPQTEDLEEYVEVQKLHMSQVHAEARQYSSKATQRQKFYYDQHASKQAQEFSQGDKVWYYRPCRKVGISPKLQKFWEGPFTVIHKLSWVLYRIQKQKGLNPMVVHVNKLKRWHPSDDTDRVPIVTIPSPSSSPNPLPPSSPVLTKSGREVKHPQWYGIPN